MHVTAGAEYAGKYANLYRFNQATGSLEYCGVFKVTENGQAMFGVSRGGEYLMTITESRVNETVLYSGSEYTVQAGDNLYKIAARNHMSLTELIRRNPQLSDVNVIRPGQKIKVN